MHFFVIIYRGIPINNDNYCSKHTKQAKIGLTKKCESEML